MSRCVEISKRICVLNFTEILKHREINDIKEAKNIEPTSSVPDPSRLNSEKDTPGN